MTKNGRKDPYKVQQINLILNSHEFYAYLSGDKTSGAKTINLDGEVLEIVKAFYEGKTIAVEEATDKETQFLNAVDTVCLNCTQDTLNDETVCEKCPVRRTVDDKNTAAEKEYLEKEVGGDILAGISDEAIHHYHRAMKDYGMSFHDGDRWAWLNTLFGYDIGADRALSIITWYDDNGMDVLEIEAEEKGTVENITSFELGFHLNFSAWPEETPKTIEYGQKEYLTA